MLVATRRNLEWKTIDRMRARAIKRVLRDTRRTFQKERAMVMETLDQAHNADAAFEMIDTELQAARSLWEDYLHSVYVEVGKPFAENTFRKLGIKAAIIDVWLQNVVEWLEENSSTRVKQITSTTRNRLQAELATGVAAGESIDKIAKRIDGLYLNQIIPNRSRVIARTETISASNLSSRQAARATNLNLEKEWLATAGARTRQAHQAASGQVRHLEEPYDVGGEKLMYPGDMAGSSWNIINCRCTETYGRTTRTAPRGGFGPGTSNDPDDGKDDKK